MCNKNKVTNYIYNTNSCEVRDPVFDGREEMNYLGSQKIPFLFIIDFEMKKPLVYTLDQIDPAKVLYNIQGNHNIPQEMPRLPSAFLFDKVPISLGTYKIAFDRIMSELQYGNSYLLNLTFPTRVISDLSLLEIFYLSDARYKLWIKNNCVVFSPESFVRISDGVITSYPMKGTIDASLPNARERILNDPKEFSEHATIVDLIRNDLSQIATEVRVNRFRYIEEIKAHRTSLLQVSSEISGKLPIDYHQQIGDIMYALLPAGSISGAPKNKTLEIIKQVEGNNRNYFTGVFGYFDGHQLDSGVMIRFIEKQDEQLVFKSGGGITAQSDLILEYQEMIDKVYVPINRIH